MTAYVYYSYEEWGRGYIGARSRSPEGDDYLGSYRDKTFKPTNKVVLAEFDTFEEALEAEWRLHEFFDVTVNPHFANRCRATRKFFSVKGRKATVEETQNRVDCWTKERRQKTAEITRRRNLDPEFQKKINKKTCKREHWKKEWWDAVSAAVEEAAGRFHWKKQELLNQFEVSERTLRKMKSLIEQNVSWDEAMLGQG